MTYSAEMPSYMKDSDSYNEQTFCSGRDSNPRLTEAEQASIATWVLRVRVGMTSLKYSIWTHNLDKSNKKNLKS